MPRSKTYHRLAEGELAEAVRAYRQIGTVSGAARSVGMSNSGFARRLVRACEASLLPVDELPGTAKAQIPTMEKKGNKISIFDSAALPSDIPPVEEILERREKEYDRYSKAQEARALIPIKIKIDGPIGIVHMGDPHVDDPGTDISSLRIHIDIINQTEGMVAANVGDLQNNWVGRLARLYGEQQTTAQEAWALVEWLVTSTPWLYLIGGNHDLWSGPGDPVKWIAAHHGSMYEAWGARLNLKFPNGKEVRINARHDFSGHSMWNPAHGAAKAVQMGWRDHIATCGHKHTSAYQMLKDPSSGLISHVLRVAGYKRFDRYAKELGLPNQNIAPASVTIIDPRYNDDDPRLITVIHDVEVAAGYLTYLRKAGS